MADIVEEIISDAVPQADQELYIEPIGEGRLIVNGSARLDDINELLDMDLEEEGIDTIGGLIFNRLGTLPRPGAELELDRLTLTVRRTSRKRVEEVLIVHEASGASPRRRHDLAGGRPVPAGLLRFLGNRGRHPLGQSRPPARIARKPRDRAASQLNRLLATRNGCS